MVSSAISPHLSSTLMGSLTVEMASYKGLCTEDDEDGH